MEQNTCPQVDMTTGKIYGCDPYSLKWWHEKGHLEFEKIPKYSSLLLYKQYLIDFWMFAIMITFIFRPFLYVSVGFFILYEYIFFFEEFWCDAYAKVHYKPKKIKFRIKFKSTK